MSSAVYLENYLDGLESLPTELERNFKLMRKLDDRAQTAMKSIDSHAKDFMRKLAESGALSEEERKERLEDIKALFGKAKEYSDDKVQLAIQTYELVDKQIRRLDNDLARFEGEIQEKASSTRAKSEEAVAKKGRKKAKDSKVTGKKKKSASSDEETGRGGSTQINANVSLNSSSNAGGQGTKKKKSKVNQEKETRKGGAQKKVVEADDSEKDSCHTAATHPSDVMDMPVDPNEPTYCLCHQVSYGEMIGCDNPDCPIEWFHFACVGLTTKPKGKWFCPKCTQDRKKK
ncbi:inhibitor of growth protein 5 isoform X1 [Drosophila persimilis]|uniref:Inhibitor of growth protein n=1 Tax=Drosophila pseudoobscura pseudoobscura TaxID=46245 RepID=A0A0R3NQW2_DROPS|nr:inhibitor of growth protein 5 isoform X1 [Drosophila pseudoobscura]XP_026843416.1 inhibitor of growth protein 5 isoform X1 [Drosophila persimilis]